MNRKGQEVMDKETRWLPGKVLGQRVGFIRIPCPPRLGVQRKLKDTRNRSAIIISLEEFHSWSLWSCLLPWRTELESNNLETLAAISDFLVFYLTLVRLSVSHHAPGFPLAVHILGGDN